MEEVNKKSPYRLYEILMVLAVLASAVAGSYLYIGSVVSIIKNVVIIGSLQICLLYIIESDRINQRFLFHNEQFFARFFNVFLVTLILALIFPLIPCGGWIFVFVFIILTLNSDINIGVVSGITLVSLSVLLAQADAFVFIIYVVPGIIASILFSDVDEKFKVGKPIFLSLAFSFLMLIVYEFLVTGEGFEAYSLLTVVANVFCSLIILLIFLKIFSFSFFYKAEDRLLDVIDPEFKLMLELKEHSKNEYDHSVFTAVLCAKIANRLGIDESLAKACGYYFKAGLLAEDSSWNSIEKILVENDIPQEIIVLLEEYNNPEKCIKSKYVVVLLFCDTIVSSIKYLFSKDRNTSIDYEKLIKAVFDKKLDSGILSESQITLEDISVMKEAFISEKLFYEFLR